MMPLATILLAAGKGTRMKSARPKVLQTIAGRPMLEYLIRTVSAVQANPIVVVVGDQEDEIRNALQTFPNIVFCRQAEPLGSGDGVRAAESRLKNFEGNVLILSGDVPLIEKTTLKELIDFHQKSAVALSLVSFCRDNPTGYGRIIYNAQGFIEKIVEESSLTDTEKQIHEVNGGIYIAKSPLIFEALQKIEKDPIKHEYFLTALPQILNEMGEKSLALRLTNGEELCGINTPLELAWAESFQQKKIQEHWMQNGVRFLAPEQTRIEIDVQIGEDTEIGPGVCLLGNTKIGRHCLIETGAVLKNAIISDRVTVRAYSYLEDSDVAQNVQIGPFAHLRPGSKVLARAKVGNFVELKKTVLGEDSKANHLSYLGDAVIGRNVNIGAGTITCNYDGQHKHQTHIGDGVFIGSDTQIVAPVEIGKDAYIAAGTTVTKNVPEASLAISRVAQKDILGYATRKKRSDE